MTPSLPATRPRVLILGGGFAAVSMVRQIDLNRYHVTVVSKRNHFLFTPLLPSSTVGTVEFRSIIEPIRKVRRGISFYHASVQSIDATSRAVRCAAEDAPMGFELPYDILVIAVGAWNGTHGVPGVVEHAMFLKEVTDARKIREKIIERLEQASLPGTAEDEKRRLLHFGVVGGGPTGVEFAAELHDLIEDNLPRSYPDLVGKVKITLFEAGGTILGGFDEELREFAVRNFARSGIDLKLHTIVTEVADGCIRLKDGTSVPLGLIVWSSGVAPTKLIASLSFEKDRSGRLLVNDRLQLAGNPSIYALGDCASIEGNPLPMTAQVAMQQGKYLGKALNTLARGHEAKPFKFRNFGMLAYIGQNRALADIPRIKARWRGVLTYLFWRSAYFTRLVSFKNKTLVLFDWFKTLVFGRDLSRF